MSRDVTETIIGRTRDGRKFWQRVETVDGEITSVTTTLRTAFGAIVPPAPAELPTDLLWCPECHVTNPRADWTETCVGCEDCGEHDALRCPSCLAVHDLVFTTIAAPPQGDRS